MKLYIMKRDALETLKANLPVVYGKYYTEKTNQWIPDICGEDPFIEFKDVTEFKLADLNSDLTPGEIDLNNCKILYEKLQFFQNYIIISIRICLNRNTIISKYNFFWLYSNSFLWTIKTVIMFICINNRFTVSCRIYTITCPAHKLILSSW